MPVVHPEPLLESMSIGFVEVIQGLLEPLWFKLGKLHRRLKFYDIITRRLPTILNSQALAKWEITARGNLFKAFLSIKAPEVDSLSAEVLKSTRIKRRCAAVGSTCQAEKEELKEVASHERHMGVQGWKTL
jgi:hypothetical protein